MTAKKPTPSDHDIRYFLGAARLVLGLLVDVTAQRLKEADQTRELQDGTDDCEPQPDSEAFGTRISDR